MAVALAATEQDVYPPRVLLSLTGLTIGDDVELFRSVAGERTAVRAGTVTATDTSVVRTDAELPFGVPVTYVAVVNGSTEYTDGPDTYTLPGGKVALSDAISGLAAEVVITAWPEKANDRVASVFAVGGRNVMVAGPRGMFRSDVELLTESTSSREVVAALLAGASEGTIQVRQAGGYDGVDCYLAVTSDSERRFSQDGSDPRRLWTLRASQVEGWAPQLEARGFTLADLDTAYTGLTLDDIETDYATLLEIAEADLS